MAEITTVCTPAAWSTGRVSQSVAAFGLALCGALAAGPSNAQVATLPSPAAFDEFYVGEDLAGASAAPAVAPLTQSFDSGVGRIIVGVSLGAPSSADKIDLAELLIVVPDGAEQRLCVSMSTSDGRYSGKSEHLLSASYDAPARLGLSTRYQEALSGYSAAELLVYATRAQRCSADAQGQAAPAVAQAGADKLVAFVNIGRGRPKAWLEAGGAAVTEKARCRKDEHAAKTHDCAVAVGGLASGVYDLVVESGRLDGPSLIERTRIVLP